jgi:dephospho-CoA kinase
VVARFGPAVVGAEGELDRAALGRIVFADAAARRDLESIIHPQVFARIAEWFDALSCDTPGDTGSLRTPGVPEPMPTPVGIAELPLLYETGRESEFDQVIVTVCPVDEVLKRLVARDGLSLQEANLRLKAQIPTNQKAARADFVIDTSGSKSNTARQVADVLAKLQAL